MMQLAHAQGIAQELITILNPFCDRIEVAGSVLRKKNICKDIELVIIPKQEITFEGLFKDEEVITYPIDKFLWEDYRFDFRLNKDGKRMYGDKNKLLLFETEKYGIIALDIFTADQSNFMMVKFIRTGGAENNKKIAITANQLGMSLKIYESCFTDRRGFTYRMDSEEQIYKFLDLPYLKPEERS
jgi:DNA polymerase/3'-5' exonuclease PolX